MSEATRPSDADAATTAPWWRSSRGAALLGVALLAFLAELVATGWLCDDAFISLRMADNLVHGRGFGFNAGDRVLAVTNPLWTLLLSAAYAATGEAFYTTLAASIAVSLAALACLLCNIAATARAAALGAAVLLLSPAFVDYGTSGLENPLTHLLLGAFLAVHLRGARGPATLRRLMLWAGLAVVNRPDSLLLTGPVLLARLLRRPDRAAALALATGAAPLLLWAAFAWLYFGSPVPNTALAKLDAGVPGVALQGLRYLGLSAQVDPVLAVAVVAGPLLALRTRVPGAAPVALGIALHLAYTVAVGGDFMVGRFLTAPLYAAVALLVRTPLPAPRRLAPAFAALLVLATAAPLRARLFDGAPWTRFSEAPRRPLPRYGISDERAWYRPQLSLLTSWRGDAAPPVAPPAAGDGAPGAPPRTVVVVGAAGVRGFRAGPDVHVLDLHALADPLLARLPVLDRDWRPGHPRRVVPAGYVATLRSGENRLEDPALGRLYEQLEWIRRGPLLAPERLRAIGALLVGGTGAIDVERYRHPPRVVVDAVDLADGAPLSFGMSGLMIRWPAPVRAGAISATLSERHAFTVTFLRAGAPLGSVSAPATAPQRDGVAARRVAVPEPARSAGFDALLLLSDSWHTDQQFRIGAIDVETRS